MRNIFKLLTLVLILITNNLDAAALKLLKSTTFGDAKINSYTSDSDVTIYSFIDSFVYAYIIETSKSLIIIDTLTSKVSSANLLKFALTLNKPINSVFLTHSHPDHIGGLETFATYKIYALEETKIATNKYLNNDFNIIVLKEGEQIKVDNLFLQAENIRNAHIDSHLILSIPKISTIVSGDLVVKDFIKQHPLVKDFDAYLKGLQYLDSKTNDFDNLLTGHTEITNTNKIKDNIEYIQIGKTQYEKSSSPEDYIKKMHQFYPANRSDDLQIKFLTK
jgi:glyoxylase-like metal-dependent hydrolase (beta-lactamase superfamily II)